MEIRSIVMKGTRDLRGGFCVTVADEDALGGESQSHVGTILRPCSQREGGLASGV